MFNPSGSFLSHMQDPEYQSFGQRMGNFMIQRRNQQQQANPYGPSFLQSMPSYQEYDSGSSYQPMQQQKPNLLGKTIGIGRLFAI